MGREVQEMYNAAFAIAKAVTSSPEMQAFYKEQARKQAERAKREAAAAEAKRKAVEAKAQKDREYDRWATFGGPDECAQFGMRYGCQPECPVFQCGQCEVQKENEKIFCQ